VTELKYGSVYVYMLRKQGLRVGIRSERSCQKFSRTYESLLSHPHHIPYYSFYPLFFLFLLPLLVFKQNDDQADRRYTAAVCSQVYYFIMPTAILPVRLAQQRRKYAPSFGTLATPDLVGRTCNQARPPPS
jgi:hypothetical protein